ncbi:hypothetical protein AJ80_02062 [Polytolypa hystricis UAMH7299]|uniref:Arabinan endo-1,5-alpha-L-arabinosidase n=1 Tax=Polytolypa hystricis (strain UAMH7299) TaxID=1447883 RepID=A0A2B7YI94_POLH7|nr:hypothetical protein AJ80_02062 [Polytolypa hystricis UAMH7299]
MAYLLVLSTLFGALAHGYAAPGACSGACNLHDPGLIRRDDGTYFRFSTGNRISYASASSIQGPWTGRGSVISGASSINLPGRDDLWAPDVYKVNGLYHVYYSVSTFGVQNSAIGLATSSSMEPNSWTDRGSIGVSSDTSKPYNAIDGNLINNNGRWYMSFGSFWNGLYQVEMNGDATQATSSAYHLAHQPAGAHAIEGPALYQHGGYYYLFFSAGVCCGYDRSRPANGEEYKIKVCRSSSPTGGFIDKTGVPCTSGGGTVVLESHGNVYGPGGQGVFNDPSLGPVLYYHYVNTNIGYADHQKLFGWNRIDFSSGWPVV